MASKRFPEGRGQTMRGKQDWKGEMPPGGAARVAVSIVVGVGWLIFLILFLAFYAEDFSIYRNLAIILVSLLVVGAIEGAMWAPWAMKTGRARKRRMRRKGRKRKR